MVKFYRGSKSNYNTTTHNDAIYFATDTGEILMNGTVYGVDADVAEITSYINNSAPVYAGVRMSAFDNVYEGGSQISTKNATGVIYDVETNRILLCVPGDTGTLYYKVWANDDINLGYNNFYDNSGKLKKKMYMTYSSSEGYNVYVPNDTLTELVPVGLREPDIITITRSEIDSMVDWNDEDTENITTETGDHGNAIFDPDEH